MAFQQTCRAIAQLARYLLEHCQFKYVLLGLIQSDNIEARFGWYRQLSGANYFISMRQLLESEKKIRAVSLLKYSGFTVQDIDAAMTKKHKATEKLAADIHAELIFSFVPGEHDQKIVFYVCGCCARSVIRTKHCEDCKQSLILLDEKPPAISFENHDNLPEAATFVQEINRGGLLYPKEHIYNLGLLCWQVFFEIKETESLKQQFLQVQHQRRLFGDIMDIVVGEHFDIFLGKTHCTKGHDIIQEMTVRFFNTMAKNFVKDISADATLAAKKRQRKALKLSGAST